VQRLDEDLYSGYLVGQQPTPGLQPASLEQLPEVDRFTGLRNFLYALEWWVFGAFAVFVWVRHLIDEGRADPDDEPDGDGDPPLDRLHA
jgi:surfeit locus 1 family protein